MSVRLAAFLRLALVVVPLPAVLRLAAVWRFAGAFRLDPMFSNSVSRYRSLCNADVPPAFRACMQLPRMLIAPVLIPLLGKRL